jgi:hypothetical protein
MANKIGSNQYIYKKRLELSDKALKSIWQVIAIVAIGLIIIQKTQPPIISPIPPGQVYAEEPKVIIPPPTTENIISYIVATFMPEGKAVALKALDCFYSESGLRADAQNWNPPYTDKNGVFHSATWDIGVAQINDVHKMSVEDRLDYRKNIDKAYQIYKNRGFSAWYAPACR